MSRKPATKSRIFREDGKPYWTGEIRRETGAGQSSVEVYTGKRKADVGIIISKRRREIRINDKIMRCPLLSAPNLVGMSVMLSESELVIGNFDLFYSLIPEKEVALIDEEDILYIANSLLLSGFNASEARQFISFLYSCIRRYKAVTGFADTPSRNFGVFDREKNAAKAVFLETNERNRIMKEALRLYDESKPYYNLGPSLMLMMYTGLNARELACIKSDDIKDDNLKVRNLSVTYRGDFSALSGTLPLPYERSVPLTKSSKELISDVFDSMPRYDQMKNSDGAGKFKRSVSVTFDAILNNTMLYDKYSSYGLSVLRNTFAVNCIRNGVELASLSKMLGHPNKDFTRIVYLPYIK